MSTFDAGGDCGVAFFLMLSGFVLSLRYGGKLREGSFHYGRFLKRRFLKLYPLHLLCLVFFLAVARPRLDLSVLLNALLLQSWVPRPDYYFSCNSVSWFLSSLFFCYLLFPFAYRHVRLLYRHCACPLTGGQTLCEVPHTEGLSPCEPEVDGMADGGAGGQLVHRTPFPATNRKDGIIIWNNHRLFSK